MLVMFASDLANWQLIAHCLFPDNSNVFQTE